MARRLTTIRSVIKRFQVRPLVRSKHQFLFCCFLCGAGGGANGPGGVILLALPVNFTFWLLFVIIVTLIFYAT
ncbi:hypothetical protein C7974DRAFT_8745 [Boeremia exigua]|uniref:uncharacterized protein n=1 Tax=Boeremia exigua TaxID=749465 RepID=UPI001E8E843C|nr:uncharacterized protein C7974DRAFT_8745 [Boeremia exigua]KAH6643898.1 hypothetical protein C7974DRAFT_8745 [Boeremia exigua]